MSEVPGSDQKATAAEIAARLGCFASGIGLCDGVARDIIEKVIADIPNGPDEHLVTVVRMVMLFVSA